MFGNPETTTGGRALKFYATMRFDVRRVEGIKQGDKVLGNRTRVKIVKNKVAPPFKIAEFDIMYGQGISVAGDVLDCGVNTGVINKSGSWFSYDGDRIAQGRENVKNWLMENPDIMEEIKGKIRKALSDDGDEAEAAEEEVNAPDIPDDVLIDDDGVIVD